MFFAFIIAVAALGLGGYLLWFGLRGESEFVDLEAELGYDEEDRSEFEQLLAVPFIERVLQPMGGRMAGYLGGLTPRGQVEATSQKLLHAGMEGIRAEEFIALQIFSVITSAVLSIAWVLAAQPSPRFGTIALIGFPIIVLLVGQSWLERKVRERKEAIQRDLADVIDLLAISVEAGTGFEGGLEVVTRNFNTPLSVEISRTLKEMELGLPRREALQNLKRRTEVPDLSNFVLVLTQADALGMPIGRVLKTQAAEMRIRRRQWAREQAGKLPVKILFPLVLFIFPAVLVVIMGPAAATIAEGFK